MKKIAFFYIWFNPPIRSSVEQMLVRTFPEYEVVPFGIGRLLRRRIDLMILNELSVLYHYGWDILCGKKKHQEYAVATPFLFKQVRKMILGMFKGKNSDYAFTFQLQSLFDTSIPGIPNFVYTDRTVLANLSYLDFNPGNLYVPKWIELEKTIYYNASMIFTRGRYISESIIKEYDCPPEKVACVFAGSNIASASKDLDATRYFNKNILFVGTDWELKGGPELVEAFRSVLKKHPDATLTIVGCSPEIHDHNIIVVGKIPVKDVPQYYEKASIFCTPTKKEAFGVVFLEAMDYKLPIIGTNVGAIPDFVIEGENGIIVQPGDVQGLAGALVDLLSDPQKCARFGERSSMLSKDRYNWSNVGKLIKENILLFLASDHDQSATPTD